MFPFYYWLPEVHCEANISISLLLAGLLLKLSLYGIIRFILSTFFISLRYLSSLIIVLTVIGILIITCSLFRYFDLKKIIALSSIIHLNTAFISLFSLSTIGLLATIIISLSHSLSSIALFLFTGLLINKSSSRYVESINFMYIGLRTVLFLIILANLSFPGSINFISELVNIIALYSIDYLLCYYFLFLSLFTTILWFILFNIKLPFNYCFNLIYLHYFILFYLLFIIYYLGFYLLLL